MTSRINLFRQIVPNQGLYYQCENAFNNKYMLENCDGTS